MRGDFHFNGVGKDFVQRMKRKMGKMFSKVCISSAFSLLRPCRLSGACFNKPLELLRKENRYCAVRPSKANNLFLPCRIFIVREEMKIKC